MPDIEFNQVRNAQQVGQVLAVESVAGVDPEAQQRRLLRPGEEPIQFFRALAFPPKTFGERAGVQFDELAAGVRGGFDLLRVGRDEQADGDPGVVQSFARLRERAQLANDVQPAFGGYFLSPLRDNANDVRLVERGRPLRRLVKRQNVTGLNFFLVEFLLPAEILFSGPVRS